MKMKKSSITLLQVVVVLVGLVVLAFMLWEPHLEGRNINATTFEIYFNDPFLAYVYTASIAFFVGLYQAFKILGFVKENKIFSEGSVKALKIIRYCGSIMVVFVLGFEFWLGIFQRGKDDITGGVFMGLLVIFASGMVVITASVLEKILQNAVQMKSENDLTV